MTIEPLPGMPLRRLERIIKRVKHYSRAEIYFPGEQGKAFYASSGCDYEGLCSEHMQLVCFPKESKARNLDTMYWYTKIIYSETRGEIFDYSSTIRRDYSTAYKRGRAGPEEKVNFKVDDNYYFRVFSRARGGQGELLHDLIYLEGRVDKLDALTKDLSSWAASGADMMVTCVGGDFPCGIEAKTISNAAISNYAKNGLTLDELSKRLVCKTCGKRQAEILPRLE